MLAWKAMVAAALVTSALANDNTHINNLSSKDVCGTTSYVDGELGVGKSKFIERKIPAQNSGECAARIMHFCPTAASAPVTSCVRLESCCLYSITQTALCLGVQATCGIKLIDLCTMCSCGHILKQFGRKSKQQQVQSKGRALGAWPR